MKKLLILCLVILSGANLLAQESNPYHEGTERTELTQEEKKNLLQYLTSFQSPS